MSKEYNVILSSVEETIVSEYKPIVFNFGDYKSEADLEKIFIDTLKEQAYEHVSIKNEEELIANLKKQITALNNYNFSEKEWKQFFEYLCDPKKGVAEKNKIIQKEHIFALKTDNNTTKNIKLIDKENIHNNKLQVINQYVQKGGKYENRYDVTILVNGLPLVHIELKKYDLKEAFNQINRYQRESFWAGCGLFEFIQIFVISNGKDTKYYYNADRFYNKKDRTIIENNKSSFDFTFFWADAKNEKITDLINFTKTFFLKHTLLNILTKYCIFTADNKLLIMKPYQIVAVERIINRIIIADNYKYFGSIKAGGYIWHATGSGKTLTSFKTAQLASKLGFIDKVLFVVDRKDLDYQTMREYDRFEKGAANSNTSVNKLKSQLENEESRIIVTTIQKLNVFIKKSENHDVFNKKVVFIFDECHRSQFGSMHENVIKKFSKYYIFGFTGTPIFAVNSKGESCNITKDDKIKNQKFNFKTTEQTFGDRLHMYTIVDAINDQTVLKFNVSHHSTMLEKSNIVEEKVTNINREKAYNDSQRIANNVKYIIETFDHHTYRNNRNYSYNLFINEKREKRISKINGFNSILATSSIESAKLYYTEFKKQMKNSDDIHKLNVAIIYSYEANEAETENIGNIDDEDNESVALLDKSSRDFLEEAIADYNKMFQSNFSTKDKDFQNYYRDISKRTRNKEIDILIVVNMFLTGFDAPVLNTLWVDKNLEMHGLIQAFSRTNRTLNDVKQFGNIVCFRPLQDKINKAFSIFGDKQMNGILFIRSYNDYYNGFKDDKGNYNSGYYELVQKLLNIYPASESVEDRKEQIDFIKLFGRIFRLRHILSSFDEFQNNDILKDDSFSHYHGLYVRLRAKFSNTYKKNESKIINEDLVFENDLIDAYQIDADYILDCVNKNHKMNMDKDKILKIVDDQIDSSPVLYNKKDLIKNFLDKGYSDINDSRNFKDKWREFNLEKREKELKELIEKYNLNEEATRKFIDRWFQRGELELRPYGNEFSSIFNITEIFDRTSVELTEKVLNDLNNFYDRFYK